MFDTETDTLLEMLTYCRPGGSKTERRFINRFIKKPLSPLGLTQDSFGNLILRVGPKPTDGGSRVLWSSHTDTVHHQAGKQALCIDSTYVSALGSSCLGADCTTGVWLMVQMALAGVRGLYIWHRLEESGGLGSSYIADKTPELLEGIDFAIAFDRFGTTSIITHQWGRCCSDAFAVSLDLALGSGWKLDDGGTFTDTANYVGLIGECTNISVGYYDQHRSSETQDIEHALYLLETMLTFDETLLVHQRVKGTADRHDNHHYGWSSDNGNKHGSGYDLWDDDTVRHDSKDRGDYKTYDAYDPSKHQSVTWEDEGSSIVVYDDTKPMHKDTGIHSAPSVHTAKADMIALVRSNPIGAATFLMEIGISSEDLEAFIGL